MSVRTFKHYPVLGNGNDQIVLPYNAHRVGLTFMQTNTTQGAIRFGEALTSDQNGFVHVEDQNPWQFWKERWGEMITQPVHYFAAGGASGMIVEVVES